MSVVWSGLPYFNSSVLSHRHVFDFSNVTVLLELSKAAGLVPEGLVERWNISSNSSCE